MQSAIEPNPLAESSKYERQQTLGQGSFGFVQLAKNLQTGELAAIKVRKTNLRYAATWMKRSAVPHAPPCLSPTPTLSPTTQFLKRGAINKYTEAEILNHSLLRHPHVIQFKEVFLASEHICIAMEYATGGSLFHYVQKQGRLREAVARWFFQQLVIGADYCHKRGVANRDIKLENTLLQMVKGLPLPLLKICDFGRVVGSLSSHSIHPLTPLHFSPLDIARLTA
jgi:serine/threonine-protein kinase SRK2